MQLVHPYASWFWDICELGIGATPLSFEESLLYYTSIMMICKHYVVGTLVVRLAVPRSLSIYLFWATPQSRRYIEDILRRTTEAKFGLV